MTIHEAYIYFINIVEKNSTNNNLNIDLARFIEWFNFTNKDFQDYALDRKNNDDIRAMQPFLSEKIVAVYDKNKVYNLYQKPEDFYDFSNLRISAKKGECLASDFVLDEEKSENIHILLGDIDRQPSFKARESFYHLMDKGIAVYHNSDFEIKTVDMKYYRAIPDVDIAGYIKADDTPSTNIDPETDDKTTVKILKMMSSYFLTSDNSK